MEITTSILPLIQIFLSVLLTISILLQYSEAGLGGAFGGSDVFGGVKRSKRGAEKIFFIATIIIAILFVLSSFANILI